MAYKDSDELKTDERYPLGDYSFRIERSSVPGSTNDKIEAICTKDGKNARKSIQVPSSTQMLGWYVEANGDTASVYVLINGGEVNPWNMPAFESAIRTEIWYAPVQTGGRSTFSQPVHAVADKNMYYAVAASDSFFTNDNHQGSIGRASSYTYAGKTVYYMLVAVNGQDVLPIFSAWSSYLREQIAWQMIYGSFEQKESEMLIARFAIDLEDAGGVGPGSDWVDPGDYDPDWEPDDPTHTLYVEVTGALSGRHNDPIEDPSYSYIPADKDTVKDYGCGGDGGHGGGGGAGASTVVIHKFATNQANSKEVTAIARRHGYGSGGGKGGKGGDGCILVYY